MRGVVGVHMRGNEVDRHALLLAVLDEIARPGGLRRRGSTDTQPRADLLDGTRAVVIEFVISGLRRLAAPKADIGLVPHFEIPSRHLVDAVTVDEVADK